MKSIKGESPMLVFTEVHVSQQDLLTAVQEGERQMHQAPPEQITDVRELSEAERELETAHVFSKALAKQRMLEGVEDAIRRRPGLIVSPSVAELTLELGSLNTRLDELTGVTKRPKSRVTAKKLVAVEDLQAVTQVANELEEEPFLISELFDACHDTKQAQSDLADTKEVISEVDGQQPLEFPAANVVPVVEATPQSDAQLAARVRSLGTAIMSRERLITGLQEQVSSDPRFVPSPPIEDIRAQIDGFKAEIMQLDPWFELEPVVLYTSSAASAANVVVTESDMQKNDEARAERREQAAQIAKERQAADRRQRSLRELEKRRRQLEGEEANVSPVRYAAKASSPTPDPVRVLAGANGHANDVDENLLSWQNQALCAQTDPEAFFPEKGGSTRDAKRICVGCEVKQECLEYAVMQDERFGIWGGLSERERRRLKRKAG
jgi:WhiB family redox-sensing transcriptional regulator